MERRTLWRVLAHALAGGVLFAGFSYLMFPAGRIDSVIGQMLAPQGLRLSPPVHKTILPGLAWDNLLLVSDQGALLQCERLQLTPRFMQLLLGRAALSGLARVGNGRLELEYSLNGRHALDLSFDGINLSEIPFFSSVLKAKMGGIIWSKGSLQRSDKGVNGELKLEVRQLEFSGIKLGAFPLPDARNLKTQGMIRVTGGKARLESFTLEGDGIYMRLSGDLPSGAHAGVAPLNMVLEIMPKPEFLEKQKLVFMLLAKFMASPGVYRVPIRGTLLKPEIL